MNLNDDLAYSKQLDEANPQTPSALDQFNSQLESVFGSLSTMNSVQMNALLKQNDMQNIITKEADRLASKQDQIDQAANNQKRIIYANDNSRKVYAAYLKIAITAAITLGIVWVIRVINFHFGEFIPDFIINTLIILAVSIGIIVICNYLVAIRSRDPYNFDELRLDPPGPLATPSPAPDMMNGKGGLDGGLCIGKYCCSPTTIWDADNKLCIVPKGTEGPQGFTTMNSISPMEPFETYGKV